MALTAKNLSTISYNSHNFLLDTLNALFESGKIEDYRVAFHKGEDGDKDHAHIWLSPNRRLDTVELRKVFNEVDPANDKPLGVLPFRKSSDLDWLLYALHDPIYLESHHSDNDGDGKIMYSLDEILTPFPEQLQRDYIRAQSIRKTRNQEIIECFDKGLSYATTVASLNANPLYVNVIFENLRHDYSRNNPELESPAFHDLHDDEELPDEFLPVQLGLFD